MFNILCIFQTRCMIENNNGDNVAGLLKEAVAEWSLVPPPPLMSDNAANRKVAANAFGAELHVGCFAHTLNLACGKALKIASVSKLLAKLLGANHQCTHQI